MIVKAKLRKTLTYKYSFNSGDSSIFVDDELFALGVETTRVASPLNGNLLVTVVDLKIIPKKSFCFTAVPQ